MSEKLGMTETLDDGTRRKFRPAKRLKSYHRAQEIRIPLREFARWVMKKNSHALPPLKTAAETWMAIKGIR